MKKVRAATGAEIENLLSRGVAEVIGKEDLKKRLEKGEKIRIKVGIDPTSPNIHIGRAATLLKLRDFQALGHTVVFIVGDFTGVIGDTSDKESERPMLTAQEVKKNMHSYIAQAGKIINTWRAETKKNSSWLSKLRYEDIGRHADAFSVSDFIARENIKRRLDKGLRVSLRELLYPLMQGYDSVAVRADLEIGGTDQRFNMLAGRTLQEKSGERPQAVMTLNLLPGTDGRKMSSSWGNTINLTDEPNDMYGKVMSLTDESIEPYLISLTRVPIAEISNISNQMKSQTINPRDAKMRLAREIVALCHGETKAAHAEEEFVRTFQKKETPADAVVYKAEGRTLGEIIIISGAATSMSAAVRLAEGGAIKNLETEEIVGEVRTPAQPGTYKIGKKKFIKIEK